MKFLNARGLAAGTGHGDYFTHVDTPSSWLDRFSGGSHVCHDTRKPLLPMIFMPCAETDSVIQRFSEWRRSSMKSVTSVANRR